MRKWPKRIAVIHLPALPGSPKSFGYPSESLQIAGSTAIEEAKFLEKSGFDGLIIENFGDKPFFKDQIPAEALIAFSVIAAAVREAVKIPIGINVLRNDALTALKIAAVTGCDFIRVNILAGAFVTDQGIIEGKAAELLRERTRLQAEHIGILADVLVKHAQPLGTNLDQPPELALAIGIEELVLRSGADGIIVTGSTTGRPVDPERLEMASRTCRKLKIPVFIGSGATEKQAFSDRGKVHGVIVSSTLRKGGEAGKSLDPKRVKAFVQAWKK